MITPTHRFLLVATLTLSSMAAVGLLATAHAVAFGAGMAAAALVVALVDRVAVAHKRAVLTGDGDTVGSPYRSQVAIGDGNVQSVGDVAHANDEDGAVVVRQDGYRVTTGNLRNVSLQTDGRTLTLTHRGQRFVIRYDPRS